VGGDTRVSKAVIGHVPRGLASTQKGFRLNNVTEEPWLLGNLAQVSQESRQQTTFDRLAASAADYFLQPAI